MKYTIEQAKSYVAENLEDIMLALEEYKEVPAVYKRYAPFIECWKAGCWLNKMLEADGATKKQIQDIRFAHGQRSAFGDPWEWAVKYANEFEESKAVKDKPGIELADRINSELFQMKP